MATALWYNDASVWLKAKALFYNDAGTWLKAKAVWYNDGGVWSKVFNADPSNPAFSATPTNVSAVSGFRTASVSFNTDGTASATSNANTTWAAAPAAGAGAGVWVMMTPTSSVNTTYVGKAINTWLEITATLTFSFSNSDANLEGSGKASVLFSLDGGATTAATLTNVVNWDVGTII